ncbi:PEP/pyruvate-binding domain-containing protein [Clostridium frigidicarnis]|uniref:Pyruvate, water dikinase n=1 Tax=Clostridium frigidicarnis TaxID=84698 RepID=A0A1I1ABW8_9CLOT|nr:PEP/pyruvate-binding domain-containing protein [Clostridium frigidicarnis]SFB35484.1 pyruvate, water dikinase [Clostridium frigidicarnis]
MFKTISELSFKDKGKYGQKASALGELKSNGFKVPEGFAISNEVFMEYMRYNKIPFSLEECLARSEEMSEKIINGKFPIGIENKVKELVNNINKNKLNTKYVVRSSASCEDNKEHSMAGMFSSFIDLNSFKDILRFIKKCYASAFNDKVVAYVINNNLDIESLKMGVVVQEFIIGEYSGVNFSVDTIDMKEDYMHINVAKGICDGFVSGKTDSNFFSIYKKDGSIVESKVQDNHKTISLENIKKLYEITLNIEKFMKQKVDIEWTINKNIIYILQTRPITTFKIREFPISWCKTGDDNYTWYCENNEPLFPLMNEISKREVQALNKDAYDVGDESRYMDFIIQNGYSYYRNMEMLNNEERQKKFRAQLNQITKEEKNIFQDIIFPSLFEMANELDSYVEEDKSQESVSDFLEKSLKYMEFTSENHLKSTYACEYVKEFEIYCKYIIKELSQQDFYDLVFNKSFLTKEREYYMLMAEFINSNNKIKSLFEKTRYNEIIYEHLKTIPDAGKFLKVMNDYIKDYGTTHLECDIISSFIEPTIMEKPARVLKYIKGFIGIEQKVYFDSIKKSQENKERVKTLFLKKLDKAKGEEFLIKLKLAEISYLSRDNHHYYFERKSNAYLSLAITAASEILKNNKIINKKEDIYFLKFDEIKKGLLYNSDFISLVEERKAEYEN